MAQKILLKNVTIAFANDLFVAKAGDDGGTPKFSSAFLFKPTDPQVPAINKAIAETAKEKWGAKAEATLKGLRAVERACVRDGDLKTYAGYAGNLYLNASNTMRPTVIDADKTPLVQEDGKPYSGCVVNASIEFWAQDNKHGKRINATLLGVQFVKDGERFAAGSTVADVDDFDDVSAGATADDLV